MKFYAILLSEKQNEFHLFTPAKVKGALLVRLAKLVFY